MATRDSFFGATMPDPGSAAPEDDANDTTFGDIGDIRAGDAASEQQWASQHDEFAKAIEMEKEQILRRNREQDRPSDDSSGQTQPGLSGRDQRSENVTPQMQPQQRMHPGHPGMSPGRQMHPDYARALLAQQQLQQQMQSRNGPEMQNPGLREQQERMLLLQQQQMRMNRQQQQMNQQPPPPMGQQQQQQRMNPPSPEMQMYMQAQAQQRQQMEQMHRMRQQQAQAPPPPEVQHFLMSQQRLLQENQHLNPAQLRFIIEQHHQQYLAAAAARARATAAAAGQTAPPPNGPPPGFSQPPGFNRGPPPAGPPPPGPSPGRASGPGAPQAPQAPQSRAMPRDAITLEDLEQTLRSTGVSEKPRRRMESMTDKDLELVLRMHLRQIDTSIPYRDDFYWAVYEDDSNTRDMYDDLGAHLRDVEAQSGGESVSIKKRLRKQDRDNDNKKVPGVHTSSNLKTLTRALGTIQSWNPRAPRRLMDLGAGDGKTAVPAVHKAIEEDGQNRLLRDDERIAVRAAVEDGYDLLSRLQDIARKKSAESYDVLLKSLLDTLHLSGSDGNTAPDFLPFESTRFFVRMCIFDKGKRYIARLLSVLSPMYAARVVTAVFENLSVLLYTIAPRTEGDPPDEFWEAVMRAVRNPLVPAERCAEILDVFCRIHAEDAGALVIVLSSAVGARLMYAIMQRVFSLQDVGVPYTRNNPHWEMLCGALAARLGDVFDAAESTKHVWEVAAMLDALSEGQTQFELRGVLKKLLESGRAPPPPGS